MTRATSLTRARGRCRARRRRRPRNTHLAASAPDSRRAASRCSSWRRATSAAVSARGVPRALRAVGAHEVVHDAARRRPLREVPPAAELDVVGMGADRERRGRRRRGRRRPRRSAQAGGCPGSFAAMSAVPRGGSGGRGRRACRRRATGRGRRARRRRSRPVATAVACGEVARERPGAVGRRRARASTGATSRSCRRVAGRDERDTSSRATRLRLCGRAAGRMGDDQVVEALLDDRSAPSSMAPFRPRPGLQITSAPCVSAQSATSSSSQATNVGSGRTAATPRSAIHRANWARWPLSSVPTSRPLAARNRLTGTSTATCTGDDCRGRLPRSPVRVGRAASRATPVDTVWTCRPRRLAPPTLPSPA